MRIFNALASCALIAAALGATAANAQPRDGRHGWHRHCHMEMHHHHRVRVCR